MENLNATEDGQVKSKRSLIWKVIIGVTFLAVTVGIIIYVDISRSKDIVNNKEEIKYVFEFARHGARAPLAEVEGFPVIAGMLTP